MSPKKPSRLTPLERLINTSLGGLMKHRGMVGRHGKKHHGLKVEDTVKLTHIRLAPTQGKVITATSLAKDLLVGRKEAEGGLQRLVQKGLVVAKEREGKEVYYESPPDYTYPSFLIDDAIDLWAHQTVLGRQVEKLVGKLDDQTLKDRFAKAVDAVKLTVF